MKYILLLIVIFISGCSDPIICKRTGIIRHVDDGNCWGCIEKTAFRAIDGKIPNTYTIVGIYGAVGDTITVQLKYWPYDGSKRNCGEQ